jgi:hypothetical protein
VNLSECGECEVTDGAGVLSILLYSGSSVEVIVWVDLDVMAIGRDASHFSAMTTQCTMQNISHQR